MEEMGGAPFMDGDWESICRILSFDQDSNIANSISQNGSESLIELLMGNSNPSTSQCELGYPFNYTNHQVLPTPFSYNLSPLNSDLSTDLNNGSLINANGDSSQFVQPCVNDDDDQISSLTSSSLGINVSKKRPCSMENRKMQPKKSKIEASQEDERKSSSESSDNESNGSHEVINEESKEILKLKGKKRGNRGGATDPQSIYARKRRERINERLRILQSLVPNGTKVDISTMLEEAVSYVKFLQMQIKLLSSDDMWMYAPLAYNGFDVGHYNSLSPQLPRL